ncbi:MAG: chromate efflux transporter [Parvibaculum sp.]|uniref:chromate efflux transporter n=1 Tax=Parvibaculum sp. TaxID=2024848 RepID=UPI0025CDD932|nr:chromate efflux transporter [Parvibaculum sp.]MCE9649082.1 chromate efflux transporter [Parvibaculum sp.]
MGDWRDVFRAFLKLGLTSFGGPVAHIGYFRAEFVERRRWLDDRAYADLVALAQFLPGPSSSQVGMGLGLMRAGFPGMFAAWLGFTLPSAFILVAFAYGASAFHGPLAAGITHGLMVVAVAVVAQAVMQMARMLTPDMPRIAIAAIALAAVLLSPGPLTQIAVLVSGGAVGFAFLKPGRFDDHVPLPARVGARAGTCLIAAFFALLFLLPLLAAHGGAGVQLFDIFYRAGALVFGGGHVVLPILEAELVPKGFIARDAFLAGYGAAQAVPGPLFTFSAYVGWLAGPGGVAGAAICLGAMFGPSFLLVPGVMPFWARLSHIASARAALMGVNAAVVGILAAALYTPVFTSAIHGMTDLALALAAFAALVWSPLPVWGIVVLCGAAGAFLF